MPNLIEKASDITLNTHDEVDQILGRPPSWLLRWGISIVFLAVFIFSIIAWLIKYPDVISAKVNITTENPAIRLVARTSGKINDLPVTNNEEVLENEIIAILDNPASLKDIEELAAFIQKIESIESSRKFAKIKPPENLALGNIQTSYAALAQKINDYRYFLKSGGVFSKIKSLESQQRSIRKLNGNLRKQKRILSNEVRLAKKDFLRQKELNSEGLVSDVNLEKSETQFLQYNRQLENIANQLVNNEISIEQHNAQIIDLKQGRKDGRSSRELNISQDIERIKSEIELWKQTYLITAPIAGKVSFAKIWSEQQFVNANEEVLTIVPYEGTGKIIGKAVLPIANSGKVRKGQTANIRLDGFPFQEYGVIKTSVSNISLVPVTLNSQEGESYLLEINLPDSLITTYDKVIPFRQEMQGTANIITEDRRVLERIFDRVNSILKNS